MIDVISSFLLSFINVKFVGEMIMVIVVLGLFVLVRRIITMNL